MEVLHYIKCKITFPGFHQWKKAPEAVSFLRDIHRHLFTLTVTRRVTHTDRDVEFFLYQQVLRDTLRDLFVEGPAGFMLGQHSCEEVARLVWLELFKTDKCVLGAEVSEDGENVGGVTITDEVL